MNSSNTALPSPLIDAVREGRAILFLGAGASYGAAHPSHSKVPDSYALRDLICDRFLNGEMKTESLMECSDYAIDGSDLTTFQRFIRDTFEQFSPASFHKQIPTFNWVSIFTTNYDLIVERAYEEQDDFSLVRYVKNGQKIDWDLKQKPNSLLFTKLHGSIDFDLDTEIPLILSSDQYVSAARNRSMLFQRLLSLASQFPVIFVGYKATDLHIKAIFNELSGLGQRRPRYFYVSPNITTYQQSYLESRRTTTIAMTFETFLQTLDRQLPSSLRAVKFNIDEVLTPLHKHLRVSDPKPSSDLLAFLTNDVDIIHSTMPIESGKDADFYEGIPLGFYPISKGLDVRRAKKTETILSDVFYRAEGEAAGPVELCLIRGEAGSGKSVFVRRLAWEAAIHFDCVCLYHRRTGSLRFSALQELYSLTTSRIFLFVDRAAYYVEEIEDLLSKARAAKLPLTIVTAERHSEWNVRCERLERYVTYDDEITRLSNSEIAELVGKLRQAGALGQLNGKSDEECKEIFEQKMNRQILVALHEATKGKPFEEIVIDEYNRIIPIEAQLLYLDICAFQRLGADLRAGLISRIGGVSFDEFKERLLKPLERVVFASEDKYGKDHVYRARHQRIAEIVFDKVLETQKSKYDLLVRLLQGINRDYSADNEAFQSLMHGSTLRAIFPNADLARQLLDEGLILTNNDAFVLHQRAVFEIQHADGDANVALGFINRALESNPADKARLHTKANIFRRLALQSDNEIKKRHLRSEAAAIINSLGSKNSRDYVLLLNLQIDDLVDILRSSPEGDLSDRAISGKIQEIEQGLLRAHAMAPADPYLLQAEHRYRDQINQDGRALAAIKRANRLNPSIAPIAIRLARIFADRGEPREAIKVLLDAASKNSDGELKFEIGKMLSNFRGIEPSANAVEFLERSFVPDDDRLWPRLYLMREYWRDRQNEKFRQLQRLVRRMAAPRQLRSEPNLILMSDDVPEEFSGVVRVREADYVFVTMDNGFADVFIHRSNVERGDFDAYSVGTRLKFQVGFSTRGATGIVSG